MIRGHVPAPPAPADHGDTRSVVLRLYTVVIDAADPRGLARWWAEALGWQILHDGAEEVVVAKDDDSYPALIFVPVGEPKIVKNRVHLDLAPDDRDREVSRLEAMGARRVDVGQGPQSTWVVLADPEGNEFCVLSSRDGGL
ncbi:MAG: VOC family protein [Acidothermus sp.]|nr:VOC family protein [Acidothermus sp.]